MLTPRLCRAAGAVSAAVGAAAGAVDRADSADGWGGGKQTESRHPRAEGKAGRGEEVCGALYRITQAVKPNDSSVESCIRHRSVVCYKQK